jgi:hypothetical protein
MPVRATVIGQQPRLGMIVGDSICHETGYGLTEKDINVRRIIHELVARQCGVVAETQSHEAAVAMGTNVRIQVRAEHP